uniref:ZP domain-containing protein n=1 Tax=Meloidogyne javanica TaxID=6303 RepID=A0A915MDQ7_MELJA
MIGGAYSLVLEMPTFGRWDVLVESCTCNGVFQFLQGGGCFRRDNFWLNKNEWRSETNKYIVVHFVAPQTLLKFDCQTLVVKCCGCCDNACGRLPLLESFSSLAMTISCQYPLPIPPSPPLLPPPVLPPSTGEYSSGCWMPFLWGDSCPSNGDNDSFWLIPFFLCLLALLLILCCLLALYQSAQTTPISPLSPINESGIDYFDKSRRNQRLIDSGNGFERFEHHAALPIIPTSPWFKNFGGRANVVGTNLEEEGFRQKINGRNGSTKFGVEKQIDTDEEDRMQIRSVSPKGTIRELDERNRWKRTLF